MKTEETTMKEKRGVIMSEKKTGQQPLVYPFFIGKEKLDMKSREKKSQREIDRETVQRKKTGQVSYGNPWLGP